MTLFNILLGVALLLLGRRLFWFFVAAVGFVVGAMLAAVVLEGQPEWMILLIAVALGLVGAMVSLFLQHVIVAIAGFLAAGYLVHALMLSLGYDTWVWIGFLAGGVVGAVLVLVLFHWALIVLSSLIGATVIVQNLVLDPTLTALLFVALSAMGVVLQAWQMKRAP